MNIMFLINLCYFHAEPWYEKQKIQFIAVHASEISLDTIIFYYICIKQYIPSSLTQLLLYSYQKNNACLNDM